MRITKSILAVAVAVSVGSLSVSAQKYVPKVTNTGVSYYMIQDNYGLDIGIADANRRLIAGGNNIQYISLVRTFPDITTTPFIEVKTNTGRAVLAWDGHQILSAPDPSTIYTEEEAGNGYFLVRDRNSDTEAVYDLTGKALVPPGVVHRVKIESYGHDPYFFCEDFNKQNKIVDYKGEDYITWTRYGIRQSGDEFYCVDEYGNRITLGHGVPSHKKEIDAYFASQQSVPAYGSQNSGGGYNTNTTNPMGLQMEFDPNRNPFHLNMEFQAPKYSSNPSTSKSSARTKNTTSRQPTLNTVKVRLKQGEYHGGIYSNVTKNNDEKAKIIVKEKYALITTEGIEGKYKPLKRMAIIDINRPVAKTLTIEGVNHDGVLYGDGDMEKSDPYYGLFCYQEGGQTYVVFIGRQGEVEEALKFKFNM